MTRCARCKREIDAEHAVWSFSRRRHYCGPKDWPSCDELWFAELAASKEKEEKDAA